MKENSFQALVKTKTASELNKLSSLDAATDTDIHQLLR